MRRRVVALVALTALACSTPAAEAYGRARLLFNLQDEAIGESSGVASYSRSSAVLWTHNDSGDGPRFFAIGRRGETLAMYVVAGAVSIDWEDMARGPGTDGEPALYLGDIGDNFRSRQSITIYEVAEPEVVASQTPVPVRFTSIRRLRYEDGPRDAETLFIDPKTRSIGIVSKEANGESGVYIAGPPDATGLSTLDRVATISLKKIARPYRRGDFDRTSRLATTGGDISPDGRRFVVRTYVEAFEWKITGGLAAGVARRPLRIALPRTRQGEAIAYTRNGRSLVTTSEQLPAPVHLVPG